MSEVNRGPSPHIVGTSDLLLQDVCKASPDLYLRPEMMLIELCLDFPPGLRIVSIEGGCDLDGVQVREILYLLIMIASNIEPAEVGVEVSEKVDITDVWVLDKELKRVVTRFNTETGDASLWEK